MKFNTTLGLALALLILSIGHLRAQQTETPSIGVWYIYFADYGLSEKWSIHHETHLHLYEPLNSFNRFVLRGGFNYKFKPALTGTFLYHYSYSDPTYYDGEANNSLIEHRLMEQLIYRQKWKGWSLSHRIRTEQRFQNREGFDFTGYRARYRMLVSHNLAGPIYLSGDGEVLSEYQQRLNTSYRLSGSLGTYLNAQLRLQVGYTHFFLNGGGHDQRLRVLLLYRTQPKNEPQVSTP